MAKGAYIGVGSVAKKAKGIYIGVDGVARKVKKAYIGDANGKARLWWSGISAYCYYNDVLLPNIEAVWTDKTTYPYAFISRCNEAMAALAGYEYVVTFSSDLPGAPTTSMSDFGIDAASPSVARTLIDGAWGAEGDASGSIIDTYITGINYSINLIWSNVDVLDTDDSVYFAASEPVPAE